MTQSGDDSPGLAAGIKGDASSKIFVGTFKFVKIFAFRIQK